MSIIYISGGLLGDFIHQLSIINEVYIKTKKKGVLYIANIGDTFRNGLDKTYNDLYEIVILQEYIEDFKIYNNEKYDIDLSIWRSYPARDNIYNIFKKIYNVEWGKNKWLNNIPKLKEWENKTIVNTVQYRFPEKSFFYPLINADLTNFVYVSIFKNEYEYFVNKTNLQISYYSPKSLIELCIILNSCERVLGSLSAPMSIATALHKKCIYGLRDNQEDEICFGNLRNIGCIEYTIV